MRDSVCNQSDYAAQCRKGIGKSNYTEKDAHTCMLLFMHLCGHNFAHENEKTSIPFVFKHFLVDRVHELRFALLIGHFPLDQS